VQASDRKKEHTDSLTVVTTCQGAASIEVPLAATLPKPALRVDGDMDFGVLGLDEVGEKQLLLVNTGTASAHWKFDCEK